MRKYALFLLITCFSLNFFLVSPTTTTCYLNTFPYEYGGTIGNTLFTAFDFIASTGALAVGGSSADTTIVGSATLYPIIINYDKTGTIMWAKRYNPISGGTKSAVNAIKFSPTQTTIAVAIAATNMFLFTLDASTGSTITSYHSDTSGNAYSLSATGLYLTTATNYIMSGTRDGTWALIVIKVGSGTGVNDVYETPGTSFGKAVVLITGESTTAFYLGGFMQISSGNSNKYTSVTRVTSSATWTSMTFGWNYVISQGTGSTYYYVSQMTLSTDFRTLYTAAQTGAAGSQIIFSLFSLSATYTVSSSTSYSTSDTSNTNFCTAILGVSNIIYAFVYNSISYNLYYYTIDMTAYTYTKTLMQTFSGDSNSMMTSGYIVSANQAYYAGYSKKIYNFGTTVSFSVDVGFVMAYDAHQSCATVADTAGATFTMTASTTFTSSAITFTTSTLMMDSATAPTVTTLGTANDGASYTCTANPYIEVTGPTITASSYTYRVASTAQVITFSAASASYLCGSTFTYTVLDSSTSVTYSFITVSSTGLTITIYSNSNADAGTYSLVLTGSVTGTTGITYSGSVSFSLTVISTCTYATISAPASIGPYSYYIANSALTQIIPSFTVNDTLCTISYNLYEYNLQPYDSSIITYNSVTNTMTVSSSDSAKVGTYTLQINAYLSGYTASITSTFYLYVSVSCSSASITVASSIGPFSYYVSDAAQVQTLTPFTISSVSCTITYTLTYDSTVVTFVPATPSITIYTVNSMKIGTYSLTLTGTVTGYFGTASTTFTLHIYDACAKPTITITPSSPVLQTYYVTNSALAYTIPSFTSSNPTCAITYTLTLADSSPIDTSLITFTSTGPSISVFTSNSIYIANYNLMITGTLTGYTTSSSATFYLFVESLCALSTITAASQSSLTYYVSNLAILASLNPFTSSVSSCGITYTLTLSDSSPIDTNLITFTPSSPSISVYTSTSTYIGTYDLKLTGTLTGSSTSTSTTFYLYVDSLCSIATISPSSPVTLTYYVSNTALAYTIPSFTSSDASCAITYTLTLSDSSPIDTSLITFTSSVPSISVFTSNSIYIGSYDLMITGTLTGFSTITTSTTFTLNVFSLCSIATITASVPASQTYYVTNSALLYTIPSFIPSHSLCPITYALTLSDSSPIDTTLITFNAVSPSISVSTSNPSYIGSYDLMITGTISGYSASTSTTFYLYIQSLCTIATLTASTPMAQTYYATNSALFYAIPSFTSSESSCGITYTLTLADSSPIDTSFITFDPTRPSISVLSSDDTYDGTYDLMITGTLTGFSITNSATFYLYVESLCSISTITATSQSSLTYYVGDSPSLVSLNQFSSSDSSCGITYTMTLSDSSPIDTSLITFTVTGPSMSVSTSDQSYFGTYDLMLIGTLTGTSISTSTTFSLYVDSLCSIATISPSSPVSQTYYVTDSALSYTIPAFSTSDSSCSITYTLTLADSSPIDTSLITFTASDPSMQVSTSSASYINTYELMITGTQTGFNTITTSATFYLYVYSLCSIATITASALTDQTYYVTNSASPYTIPSFTSSISSCSITYTLSLSDSTPIDTSLITFTASTPSMSVYTINPSYIGNYELMITGTLTGFTTTTSATFYLNVYSLCTLASVTPSIPVSQIYFVTDAPLYYLIPSFTSSDSSCGITYTLTLADSSPIDTSLITFTASDPSITVSTSTATYIGTYDFILTGTLIGFSIYNYATFSLSVYSVCAKSSLTITPSTLTAQTYNVSSTTLSYIIPQFTPSDSSCLLTYSLSLANSSPYDSSLITFDPTVPSIKVFTTSIFKVGLYNLIITGTVLGSTTIATSTFTLTVQDPLIPCLSEIITASPVPDPQYYIIGNDPIFVFLSQFNGTGSYTNCGPITYEATLTNGSSLNSSIFTFLNDSLALKVYTPSAIATTYNISIIGYYLDYPTVNTSLTFTIDVMNKNRYSIPLNPVPPSFSSSSSSFNIIQSNWTYNYTNKTVDNSSINVLDIVEQIKNVTAFINKTQPDHNTTALTAYISEVSMNGIASVIFSELIDIPSDYESIDSSYLNILYLPSSEQMSNITLLSWNISSFSQQVMVINLYFSDPLLVSQNIVMTSLLLLMTLQIKDQISIEFIADGDFRALASNQPIQYLYNITAYIPPQLTSSNHLYIQRHFIDEYSLLSTIGNWIMIGGTSIAGGAFTLSFALQESLICLQFQIRDAGLSQLWALINYLQLIILLPSINLVFPANTQYFFGLFTQIATFQFYDFTPIIAQVTKVNTTSLNDAPQFIWPLGINSSNIFINQATSIIAIFGFGLGIIIAQIVKRIQHKNGHLKVTMKQPFILKFMISTANTFYQNMVYGSILRQFIEGYLFFAISTLLACPNITISSPNGSTIAADVLTIICLAFVVLFPLMSFFFLKFYRDYLHHHEFQSKFVSLYADIDKRDFGIYYTPIFLFRRLMLSATLTMCYNYSGIQIIIFIQQSIVYMIFLFQFKVYIEPKMLRNEFLNEIILLTAIILCIQFTDFMDNESFRRIIGGCVIALMVTSIFMNLGLLIYEYLRAIKLAFRKLIFLIKRRLNRNRVQCLQIAKLSPQETESSPPRKYLQKKQSQSFMNISPNGLDFQSKSRIVDDSCVPVHELAVEDYGFDIQGTHRQLTSHVQNRRFSTDTI